MISTYAAIPPIEGNSQRILNLTRGLRSLGHDVYFILLPSKSHGDLDLAAHGQEFGNGRFFHLEPDLLYAALYIPRRICGEIKRRALHLIRSRRRYYHGLDEYFPEAGRLRLRSFQRKVQLDAVMVEYVFQSGALNHFSDSVLKVIDAHDQFADRHITFNFSNYLFSIPVSEQARGFRRADVVVAIQQEEAEVFRRQLGSEPPEVAVVSHLLDLDRKVTDYSPSAAVFLGSGNIANVTSVTYFIDKVLPLVRSALPDFELVLAGSICKKIPYRDGVAKLGIVDHVSDAFAKAPISLNPMLQGTGINIKLLDALAAGVVTVSTQTGIRGLPQSYRSGVVAVADHDAEAFAAELVALLKDQSLRQALGESAYRDAIAWNAAQMAALSAIFAPAGASRAKPAAEQSQG